MFDDAVSAVAELAASQHGVFTRRQAAALEPPFDRSRLATALARGWITERYTGVYVVAGSPTAWFQQLKAATLAAGAHAVASHRAAARLHGIDGFADSDVIEVSVTRDHRWRHRDGTIAHHVTALDLADLVEIENIACTGLARTLVDLGSVCPDPLVVRRALTDLRRRGTSLHWIQRTAERLHRPGQRGSGLLLAQLATVPHAGHVPDSWMEELLALCLVDADLGPVVPQYRIRRPDGSVVAKTDIGLPEVKLGLEGHSRQFHFGPDAEPLDEQRDLAVATCGWELQYLGWYAARRPAEVLAVIEQVVAARRAMLRGGVT
jgi:hypothetical protein